MIDTTVASRERQSPLSSFKVPPRSTTHWVAHRKAQVVRAVEAGILTAEEAVTRYRLTVEELTSWARALHRHGVQGLQVQYLQVRRRGRNEPSEAEKRRK